MRGLRAIDIAIVFSPDWACHAAVEVYSIFSTNPPPVRVYLILDRADDIGDLSHICDYFGAGYSCERIGAEALFRQRMPRTPNIDGRFTRYTLYRLLLPELIREDRLLYIDADAIVNGSLDEFYSMDMAGCLVAGVSDSGVDEYGLKAPLGLGDADAYINAGVILMDLAAIRAAGVGDRWIQEANDTFYPAHDQDIINLTCRGRIMPVDLKYNVSLSTGLDESDIRIMHWAGQKPWDRSDVPHHEIWRRWIGECGGIVSEESRIPKKIHCCWFGQRAKPPIVERCLATWREHLSDYEILEWNEHNFDIDCCAYVRDAYKSGKYAFVTDYARLWALYHYGGIYMDGDVEVLHPFDRFLHHRAFTGHETDDLMVTAVTGAEPGHPWIKMLLDHYAFANFDPIPNTQVITQLSQPFVERRLYGFRYLRDGVVIYPVDTFAPFDHINLQPMLTENTYARHLFAGSWTGRTVI